MVPSIGQFHALLNKHTYDPQSLILQLALKLSRHQATLSVRKKSGCLTVSVTFLF